MWRSNKQRDAVINALKEGSEWIIFDTETTGLSNKNDRIIQISAMKFKVESGELVKVDELNQYIKQPYPLPVKITEITGITDDILSDKPFEKDVFYSVIFPYFGNNPIIVPHNQKFDVGFLKNMYQRYGEFLEPEVALDTIEMARDIIPYEDIKSYKLGVIAAFYGVDKDISFHNAMDDVTATSRILKIFINEYKKETKEDVGGKITPKVTSIRYWEGYSKFLKRIYVNTYQGVF